VEYLLGNNTIEEGVIGKFQKTSRGRRFDLSDKRFIG